MEAFVHLAKAEKSETYFAHAWGDERVRPIYLLSSTGPLAILAARFVKATVKNFGAAMEKNRRLQRFGTQQNLRAPAAAGSISRPASTRPSTSYSYSTSIRSSTSATTSRGQQLPVA